MAQTVIYARVSKAEQDREHQEQNLVDYAKTELGFESFDILGDDSTGTDTDRSGYREMLERVRNGEVERVVVREVTRLGRTMRDISENVHEMVDDHNVGLYVMNDDIEVEAGGDLSMSDKMLLNVLAWAAELEAKKIQENTKAGIEAAQEAGKWVGRPPYGFSTDDEGYLQPNENFEKARRAITAVRDNGWSKRKAARHSGVPRSTLGNILERESLYEPKQSGQTPD